MCTFIHYAHFLVIWKQTTHICLGCVLDPCILQKPMFLSEHISKSNYLCPSVYFPNKLVLLHYSSLEIVFCVEKAVDLKLLDKI